MRKITLLVLFCCTHLMMLAQTKNTTQNETPARIKCYTTEYMAELRRANPRMQTDEQFEQFMATAIAKRKSDIERGVVQPLAGPYVINVIVHVLHSGQAVGTYPNLLQRQIASQIRVLNEDFNRTNADAVNTPIAPTNFAMIAGSVGGVAPAGGGIVFQLARQDPAGNLLAEAGVHRYQIPAATTYNTTLINGTFKPATAWDNARYMNFWTIANPVSASGALYGYAQFPNDSGLAGLAVNGGGASTDGLVMAADAFGSNYDAAGAILPVGQRFQFSSGADKGRTVTHELGHGLGLRHIWGDAACGDDFCADTPVAAGANQNPCYVNPKNSTCAGNQPEMFMNYMDYTLDACMNLFTQNQMTRMVTVMNVSPGRNTLTAATVGNCPVGAIGLTRPAGAYPAAGSGQAYSQSNVGTGGGTPNPATGAGYVYTLGGIGLPVGLTLNTSTGVISGTTTVIGTYNFTITPSGAAGVDAAGASTACAGTAVAYTLAVIASSCPTQSILPVSGVLSNAIPGVAYSQSVVASGAAPYTYAISTGVLPIGLTLSPAGLISGTAASPQAAISFIVLATNGSTPACSVSASYTLAVVAPVCVPAAVVSTYPYTQNFDSITGATGAIAPLPAGVGVVTNSAMPCGWSVHNQNGDTRTFNTYTVGFAASSANSGTNAMIYIYDGTNAADDWAITQGFAMNAGQTYNIALQYRVSADATATYPEKFEVRWGNAQTVASMTAGTQLFTTPPAGATNLTYQATTPMTITPTTTGTYYIGIHAQSAADQYFLAIDDFSVTTTGPVCGTTTFTPATATTLTAGTAGSAYSRAITSNLAGAVFTATGLPAGLSISGAGVISGTPTVAATSTVVVTAAAGACSGTATYTLVIGQNLTTAINSTLSNEVKVSPNPSKADFNIDFASLNLGKVAIRVYDAQGKQVLTTSTSNNTAVISLEKFAKGMYLMEIESQKGRILKRIVKE